jgi:hypothetical protein
MKRKRWWAWLRRKKQAAEPLFQEATSAPSEDSGSDIDPFMRMVLCTFYGQTTDPEPDRLKVSNELLEHALKLYNQMPGRPEGAKQYTLDSPEVRELFGQGLALTPGKNVLGRIHHEAFTMMETRFHHFQTIPVGLGKDPHLRGRLFCSACGDMAIVLSLGYFYHLYQFNEITFRAIQEAGEKGPEAMAEWMYLLFSHLSHYIGRQTTPWKHFPKQGGVLSRDQNELIFTQLVTNAQQLFVLLHEFGHVVQLTEHGLAGRMRLLEWENNLERDLDADAWAAARLAKHSTEYYRPSVQMQGLFWLFEYYHVIETLERKEESRTARRRFDQIRYLIDPQQASLPHQSLVTLRATFDHFLAEHMAGT